MSKIVVYSSILCPYCHRAKRLLKSRNLSFEEIDVGFHPARREEMERLAGGRTSVPQIFIGAVHVGGCDDLVLMEKSGELDKLIDDEEAERAA